MKSEIEITEIVKRHGGRHLQFGNVPSWVNQTQLEGVELQAGKIRSFWIQEGSRVYDEVPSQPWQKVIDEIEAKPIKAEEAPQQNETTEQVPAAAAPGVIAEIVETKEKKKLIVSNFDALSKQYGIPIELGNLFFVKFDDKLYIKNPGLLYIASKKGYSGMQFSQKKVGDEWVCEYRIYPAVAPGIIEAIAKLSPELQKQALDAVTMPTIGEGRASKANVRMTSMHTFLPEMAQTRAQNRALRAFTGYGGVSVEELPEYETKELA